MNDLEKVAPDPSAERLAAYAAAEETLILAAVEKVDEHDGVHREHEEPRLLLRDRAAAEPRDPLGEQAPRRRQDVAFDADVDLLVLHDAPEEELRHVRVVGEEVEELAHGEVGRLGALRMAREERRQRVLEEVDDAVEDVAKDREVERLL